MKFSSSFKVGLLSILALILLLGVVLKVKGRAISNANRLEIQFKDVNGLRPGAGVQMMGLRVGQVEEVQPIIAGEDSHVKLKFVITDPNVSIPKASTFSIQQSGLIGELFLEITPPKIRTVYLPMTTKGILAKDDNVEMKLDDTFYSVGKVKKVDVVAKDVVPVKVKEQINTNYAYKIDYIIDLPGLIVPQFLKGKIVKSEKSHTLRIATLDDVVLPYPKQDSQYTIIEPMRISDFMDWQYQAAESLTETNKKVNEILSDEVIAQLKSSVANINSLTAQTTKTMLKIDDLIDSSRKDIDDLMELATQATEDFNKVATGVDKLLGDPQFRQSIISTTDAIDKFTKNINKIIGNEEQSEQLATDIRETIHNLTEISESVNSMTGDEKLKNELKSTVSNANKAMIQVSTTLEAVNKLTPDKQTELSKIMDDACITTSNLRKFSEKLNKRFLLFRLLF